ncbi:MAG: SIR2 family protein [Terriglobales bacterium]
MSGPALVGQLDTGLKAADWLNLLSAIKLQRCTPFLGAGASAEELPAGAQIAQKWADEYGYPFADSNDLIRVAQFVKLEEGPEFLKLQVKDRFSEKMASPDFADPDEPHRVLADLNLPVYMTTNYDLFMADALRDRGKNPHAEICRWNDDLRNRVPSVFDSGFKPTSQEPVVFHLHGCLDDLDSLVLTEDDYLDYLMNLSQDQDVLPPVIKGALARGSVLFFGYKLADWNFQVMFRSIAKFMGKSGQQRHVSVQLEPLRKDTPEQQKQRAREYLGKYFQNQHVSVYWGDCRQFARELHANWESYNKTGKLAA